MAARVFAVLAAVFGVVAIAVASMSPRGHTLAQALGQVDDLFLAWLQRHSMTWAWVWLEEPLLLRPVWMLPAILALVCCGLALSFNFGATSPSRRRS
jgi:hypothetical protein